MFEKYKDGDLITLKLSSGEEVIAKFKNAEDTFISIEKALVLMQGPQGLAMGTFFSTAKQDDPMTVAKQNITAISYINDKIAEEYKRVFSTIKAPTKPSLIV